MIEKYKNNYNAYLHDQMVSYESFEGDLYRDKIHKTIDYVFAGENRNHTILDFCCGDGTSTKILIDLGFDFIEGFDGNYNKIKRARERNPNVIFDVLDSKEIDKLTNKYDIIYASHCFEHFLDPIEILIKAKKLLNPKGEIILILPYPNFENEGHPGSGELKLDKSMGGIEKLFMDNGFVVEKIEEINIREPELLIILR